MDPNIGKKVNVLFPGQKSIERVLHEDFQGLFVKYNGKITRVKPKLDEFGDNHTNSYVKTKK